MKGFENLVELLAFGKVGDYYEEPNDLIKVTIRVSTAPYPADKPTQNKSVTLDIEDL